LFTNLQPGYELESTVLSAIVFGGAVGGYFTVTTQSIHRAALVAVSGLNQSERSEAINAVLRGPWSRPASPGHSIFREDRLSFVVLVVLAATLLPLSVINARRIQRNVARLAASPV
jgi:hypothetical protein